MVLKRDANIRDLVRGLGPSVKVDMLANVMVKTALEGYGGKILDNSTIQLIGSKI